MASGHGYGNVGDEAQCGACIDRWREVAPDARITVFTPSTPYTSALHNVHVAWAPRVAWFCSNTGGAYSWPFKYFALYFFFLRLRLVSTAWLMRLGLPIQLCNPRESGVLYEIFDNDILHISGGGFLTGKTRTRLWENGLLMEIAGILKTKVVLTGHNIGVFQDKIDERIIRRGLKYASFIGLRDKGLSEAELKEIGVSGKHVVSSCDDALLCGSLSDIERDQLIAATGADPSKPWIAVNLHYWGLCDEAKVKLVNRFTEGCQLLMDNYGVQLLFIAMISSDQEAEQEVIKKLNGPAFQIPYSPDYKVSRSIIKGADFVFTMKHHPIVFAQGEGVPVLSIAVDPYYELKNKGALKNTGHENFVLNAEQFYGEVLVEAIHSLSNNLTTVSKEMKEWGKTMKMQELSPYQQFLKFLDSGS